MILILTNILFRLIIKVHLLFVGLPIGSIPAGAENLFWRDMIMSKVKGFMEFIRQCFRIHASSPSKYSQEQRLIANIICLICMGILAVTTAWLIVPCVSYLLTSGLKHLGNTFGQEGEWGVFIVGNELKSALIEGSDVAKFLSDCANTSFGNIVQKCLVWISFILSVVWTVLVCQYTTGIYHALQEMYLLKHQNGRLYLKVLDNFIAENRYKSVSYRDMRCHRLYVIFKNEPEVHGLLACKHERMLNGQ